MSKCGIKYQIVSVSRLLVNNVRPYEAFIFLKERELIFLGVKTSKKRV